MRLPLRPPSSDSILEELSSERFLKIMRHPPDAMPAGKYHHWDTLRHLTPPDDLTHREWWFGIKAARTTMLRPIPLADPHGSPFLYAMPDPVLRSLHEIDRDASGRIEISEQVTNPATRDRYIIRSLIEEAATSSQLEGAATTIRRAKELIRTGQKPINRSEQMVVNNFRAMRHILDRIKEPLTPDLVFELHRIVTEDTLDDPGQAGRFRRHGTTDEEIHLVDRTDGTTLHVPPPAELPDRMTAMCAFANAQSPETFVHPAIRAILLHFWLAYDHPFVDGNGRAARALFYWSMVSQGLWLSEYISISKILRNAPAKYARSFLFTETDENDLTYFVLYQLDVIQRAINELQVDLARKAREVRAVEGLLRQSTDLNHRQLALLGHAIRNPDARYTIESHRTSHNVVYQTARTDLHDLVDHGFLARRKSGKRFVFSPPVDLVKRLRGPFDSSS